MQIIVNDDGVITTVIKAGTADGAIDVTNAPNDIAPLKYKYVDGDFISNPDYGNAVNTVNLNSLKAAKVEESKTKLAEWLENNPMTYTDGKFYSVTAEKQSLLNSNLASYERAASAGIPYPLKWNAHGEECTEWTYEALVGLSLAIAAYVAPKVALQQALEIEINACETAEQLDKVVIDYGE